MTVTDKIKAIQEIGTEVEIPFFEVSRVLFGSGTKKVTLFGELICLGGDDADYVSLEECRTAIEWYVMQLGGTVKWKK